ncbi:MAG TPA: alpha/beta fold hydrolase [Rhizomicrobium sp.]|nr:alpha/beta fold hydrolase [Rhizomicrobium sp.]
MGVRFRAFCAFFVAASFQLCVAASAAPPVEAFGSLPAITSAGLSPDGKHLAVIGPAGGRNAVTVFTLDAPNAKPMRAGFPDADAIGIQWANNNRLICIFKANIKRPGSGFISVWVRAISVAMDGGNAVVLMHDAPFYADSTGTTDTAAIADMDPADPDHVYMVAYESGNEMGGGNQKNFQSLGSEGTPFASEKWVNDVFYLNFFKVSVSTGDSEIILHGTPETIRFVTDGRGHVIGRIDRTADLIDHFYVGAREVAKYDASKGDKLNIVGLTPDGNSLLAVSYGDKDFQSLFGYQFGSAGLGTEYFSTNGHDIDGLFKNEWTGRISGVAWMDDKMEYKYFDPNVQRIKERIEKALPGQSIEIVSSDQAQQNFVVRADAPKNPETFYLFTPKSGQLSIVGSAYPGLTAADLGEERAYPYASKDGTPIHSYLTLPPGKPAKNLPTIVLPHGGPEDRDLIRFDWLAQFFASRGYAVLQPNFRGSSSYGIKFRDAGDGQWNTGVLDDINAGTEQLIKDGIADPKRVCIFGWSYGGYAALAAATFSPNLYACAGSFAGVSDLQRMLDRTKSDYGEHSQDLAIWEKRMGASISDGSKLAALSPVRHADQVKAPILLMHSDKDVTVYFEQSEAERDALESAGKSVQFVKMEGDDHYLLHTETRVQMLKTVEAFLAQHIGN